MAERDEKGRFLDGTDAGPGRPCGYDTAMDAQAFKLALLGLTDAEMARFFDVSRNTLHRWKAENPGFRDAVQRGKEIADAEVAHALYKRATGMRIVSEKAWKGNDGKIVIAKTVTEVPPDTRAAIHWLANRRRGPWAAQDRGTPTTTQGNTPEEPGRDALESMTIEELDARIEVLEARRRIEREG